MTVLTAPQATAAPTLPDLDTDAIFEQMMLPATPWVTIVWDDPVNLMNYVTYVFENYFGYSRAKAQQLMMQVHQDGKAVVASGTQEEMQRHTEALHRYGLWATFANDATPKQ